MFNYDAAKQAGYTDEQIGAYMRMKGVKAPQKKSVGGFMGNIVGSGFRAVGDLGGALINTVNPDMEKNTVANLGKLVIGTLQYIDPTQALGTKYEKNAKAVGQFYLDRYGSVDKVINTLYNDPVGMALDVGAVLSGAGGALKGAGSVSKVAGLTKVGNAFSKAASFADPISLAGRGGGKILSGTRGKLISKLDSAGENLVTRGIGNPAAQAKAARKGGRSVASFIDEYDLYDRSPDTASTVKRGISNQYDTLATKSGKSVQMANLVKQFNDEIARLQGGVNGVVSDANQSKIAELVRRRDQLLQAAGGAIDDKGNLISSPLNVKVETLTDFRRNVIDPDVPQSMFNLDAKGSGAAQGVKQSRDIVKSGIDSSDKRLAKLGRDYGMAKSLEKILSDSQTRGQNRQMFNFTKLGGAGVGGIISGAPGVVTGFALESMVNHPKFIAGASKAMRAGARTLRNPKIPNLTAKMGRVVVPAYSLARAGRMVNPVQKTPISTNKQTIPQRQLVQKQSLPYNYSYSTPKNKTAQAFGGNVRLQRGSFY